MSFHFFHINEVFSNADGTVQFIEFVGESNGQHLWGPHSIISSHAGDPNKTFDIPANLPSNQTNGKSVLVATQGFANLGFITPDYIVPNGFLYRPDGTVNFPGMDSMSYTALPDDGTLSESASGFNAINSPKNFAGATGTLIVGSSGENDLDGTNAREFLAGLGGNDTLDGGGGNDTVSGGSGNDTMAGGAGNDILDGGSGNDTMNGGTGNDTYIRNAAGDVVTENPGAGTDTVMSAVTYTLGPNLEKMTLTGTGAINGTGNELANTLTGNVAKNRLNGAEGNDFLKGLKGADVLTGGEGADRFDFDAIADSGIGSSKRDKILDFVNGEDRIDLSTIDAKAGGGDNAFKFIGTKAFSKTDASGQLRFDAAHNLLLGSTDADSTAEFSILLTNIDSMAKANFIL